MDLFYRGVSESFFDELAENRPAGVAVSYEVVGVVGGVGSV